MKKNKGFSLLELLVVISIISILIVIASAAFSTAQKKSRDARRKADVKAIQSAFEQYYAANSAYGTCAAMQGDTNTLPGGYPLGPKGGTDTYVCSKPTADRYCVCATMETNIGNATSAACAGMGTTTGGFQCVINLQ